MITFAELLAIVNIAMGLFENTAVELAEKTDGTKDLEYVYNLTVGNHSEVLLWQMGRLKQHFHFNDFLLKTPQKV